MSFPELRGHIAHKALPVLSDSTSSRKFGIDAMTLDQVMDALAVKANPATKRTYLRHGACEPLFGVRIGDLKPLQKKLKGDQELAMQLYATKNSDAMYLAGLIANGAQMTRKDLNQWAAAATWHMIAGCTVAWVAAEHPDAIELACEWIDSPRKLTVTAGWATLASVVATAPDADLPIPQLEALLDRCARTLKTSANRVRYVMNTFVICCGAYVQPLGEKAIATARKIGAVEVDMGQTDCRVPDAESYIVKARRGAAVAPKRKTTRC
jgi:3-methyladenine DNA glycosylase AlkD